MSPIRPTLIIRILRNKVPSQDNTVTIRYLTEDSFSIVFHDPDVKQNHSMRYTANELRTYVRYLIALLKNDSDPFESIQFLFPGFPSVLYRMDKFQDITLSYDIIELLNLTIRSWPTLPNEVVVVEDEDEDEEEGEDEEENQAQQNVDAGCICGDDTCDGKKFGCEHGNCDCDQQEDEDDEAEQDEEHGCDCHGEGGEAADEDQAQAQDEDEEQDEDDDDDEMPPLIRMVGGSAQPPPPPQGQQQQAQRSLFSPFQVAPFQSIWSPQTYTPPFCSNPIFCAGGAAPSFCGGGAPSFSGGAAPTFSAASQSCSAFCPPPPASCESFYNDSRYPL